MAARKHEKAPSLKAETAEQVEVQPKAAKPKRSRKRNVTTVDEYGIPRYPLWEGFTSTVARTFTFESAHRLPSHRGKCAILHGHSYSCTIKIKGPVFNRDIRSVETLEAGVAAGFSPTLLAKAVSPGMVIDFAAIDEVVAGIKPMLDHRTLLWECDVLTSVSALTKHVTKFKSEPTSEFLSHWIQSKVVNAFNSPVEEELNKPLAALLWLMKNEATTNPDLKQYERDALRLIISVSISETCRSAAETEPTEIKLR